MKLFKKIVLSVLAVGMTIFGSFSCILAEEDFENNGGYYASMCAGTQLSEEQQAVCQRYAEYLSSQSDDLRHQLEEIESQREEIAANINEMVKKIGVYQEQINALATEITQLNTEINELVVQINDKTEEVERKELEKKELMEKVKDRMEEAQGTMRLNQYIDFIMGAQSFTDLIRRINGVNDLMAYDDHVRTELVHLIDELNADKIKLEEDKAALEIKKTDIEAKQKEIMAKQHEAEVIKQEYLKQEAALEEQGNKIVGNLNAIKDEILNMADSIGEIPASKGWTKPVPSYAYKTAGTWYYPKSFGGGVHLGVDLAYGTGTPVYAVANGVVIKSVDGCSNNGYLGNACGGSQGGTSGGGNQIIMLARVDGLLYAIKYLHLRPNTLVANYSKVTAGDKIAEMGGSGNSTGPHLHIEVYKLGKYSINEYIENWNGNLAFGCGWGKSALNRTCDKSGSPCRERPEEIFGY